MPCFGSKYVKSPSEALCVEPRTVYDYSFVIGLSRLILPAPQHDIRNRLGIDVVGILEHMAVIVRCRADAGMS